MRKTREIELGRRRSYGADTVAGFGGRLLGWIYLASAIGGISQTAAFQCPPDHYPYPNDACSSCFTIVDGGLNFEAAQGHCILLGGELTTIQNETDFELLSRYLGGLRETRKLWIGYRLTNSGSRIGLEGNEAPDVVRDDNNFNGSTSGDDNSCIGIWNGKFIVAPCTNALPFICTIVYNAPSAIKQPNVDVVYAAPSQATNVQLQATVSGTGIKFVEWKFNGTGIEQGENGITVSKSSQTPTGLIATLTISSYVPASHLGTYELLVTSQAGTAVMASWLLRNAVIDLTVMPSNLSIPEGQLAAFECYGAESKPRPTVTWYKDSSQITNGSDPRVYISELSGTLFIRGLRTSDAGLYHCAVMNVAGRLISHKASLIVLPSGAEFGSQFILNPRSLIVLTGEPYSVECLAVQVAQPLTVTTIQDHQGLAAGSLLAYKYPDSQGFPIYRVGVATFEEPECYYCATESRPFDPTQFFASQKSFLTVHAAAQVERLSTIRNKMRTEDDFQSIPAGDSAILECEFSGIPTPNTVDWTRDGISITNQNLNRNVSSVIVSDLSDSGIYQCHVENVYGKDSQTVFLCAEEQEDGIPGPVTFTAEPDTNTTIYVRWNQATPPRTSPLLLRYEILFYDTTNNTNLTFGPFLSSQMNYTITGLEPNTEYNVSLVATSLQGRSDVASQSVHTFPNPPTENVNNITVERNDNNTFLIIQWESYRTSDGEEIPMVIYEIEYRVFGSGDPARTSVVNGGNSTLGIIGVLSNAASYEVRVRVRVQIVRDPSQFVSSKWSDYIRVHGITTLPMRPTPPQTDSVVPVGRGGLTTTGLLLLIIFVVVGVILIVVLVISAIVMVRFCLRKPGGKYTVQHARRNNRSRSKGPQTPMRDEVFTIPTSLPTSPSPPPLSISNQLGGSRHSSGILGSTDRERGSGTVSTSGTALIRNQENGTMSGGTVPVNVSNLSLRRGSVSPQPLPPPIADMDNPYSTNIHTNLYTMEPFTNHNPYISPPPPVLNLNASYTDQVHDIPSHHFHKLDISDQMFEGGSPEVFDRLEGFEPVRMMATFDIITTGGVEGGSCDTLTRDGIDSRNDIDSPATMSSLVNQTPEPQADHRVTFAPAVITISPESHVNQELNNAIMDLNSSNCNNNERFFASGTDISNFQLPPVAAIVEGEELSNQMEPSSTITL